MAESNDIAVSFEGTSSPWFVDPDLRRIFSGDKYGMKAIAAMGPADFSRVIFEVTTNPRDRILRMRTEEGYEDWIVHEAFWVVKNQAKPVYMNILRVIDNLDRSRISTRLEDIAAFSIPKRLLGPLFLHAADKAGAEGMRHSAFHAMALGVETEKLRARLAKSGISPAIVAAHHYV